MSEVKKQIGFRIEIIPHSQYDHDMWKIMLYPMEYEEHRHRWTGHSSLGGYAENALSHLVVETWGSHKTRRVPDYYECRVKEVYSANSGEAAAMAKLLLGIERTLLKAKEIDGEALSFGQYCLRVAKAVKATRFLTRPSEGRKAVTGEDWDVRTLADGQSWIDYEIRKWQAEDEKEAA